jgi:hypothetical protein
MSHTAFFPSQGETVMRTWPPSKPLMRLGKTNPCVQCQRLRRVVAKITRDHTVINGQNVSEPL